MSAPTDPPRPSPASSVSAPAAPAMESGGPRVDFYVHETPGMDLLLLTACRLAEKALGQSQRVFIHTDSEEVARALDERLWIFHDRSFIPHARAGSGADAPVLIGCGEPPAAPPDLLINLGAEVPPFLPRCGRVADLVDGEESRRAQGRERFRRYREQGAAPATHKL